MKADGSGPGIGVRLIKSLLRISLAVVIGATLFLMIFEKSLIYYPARGLDAAPDDAGLKAEDVTLDVESGVKVHGWFIRASAEPSRAVFLFSHGNAGNIADRLDRVRAWRSLNADFLLYDYRGYGRSTGEPDEEGTYRDARAAYDYLTKTRGIDPSRIILAGESLGCAVTVQLATEKKAAGVFLEAPFASIPDMAAAIYPFLPARTFVRTRYDNLDKIAKIGKPLLLVQGTADEVIPPSQGQRVFDAAIAPKEMMRIAGAHHNDVYPIGGEAYVGKLSEFLDRVIPSLPPAAKTIPFPAEVRKP